MDESVILPEQVPVMPLPGAFAFSTRTASSLHFRAALPANAEARARSSSDVLRRAAQTALRRVAIGR